MNFGCRSSVAGKTTQSGDGKKTAIVGLDQPRQILPVLCRIGQGNTLRSKGRAVPPSVSKANAVGGSVVPTNGRPNFSGDMASTPESLGSVTGPQAGGPPLNSAAGLLKEAV